MFELPDLEKALRVVGCLMGIVLVASIIVAFGLGWWAGRSVQP